MMPVAILAGGLAKRLGALSENIPKSLIEIKGKPFIEWQLELLVENNIKKVIYCVSHKSELIVNHFANANHKDIEILFSFDSPLQLGTGGALKNALPLLGQEFMVLYGDSYLPISFGEIENSFKKSNLTSLMTIYKNFYNIDASNVTYRDGIIISYNKNLRSHEMAYIDYGLSIFKSSVFETSPNNAFDLSELQSSLSANGLLSGFEVYNRFYEIGSIQGILDFTEFIERHKL